MEIEPLPATTVTQIFGLLEVLNSHGGKEDIYRLAKDLHYELGELREVLRAGELLGFVHTPGGDAVLTDLGRGLVASRVKARKRLFREQLRRLTLIRYVSDLVEQTEDKAIEKEVLLEVFAKVLPQDDPEEVFKTLVNWSRHAELFRFNRDSGQLSSNVAK